METNDNRAFQNIKYKKLSKILEVGCGTGALLYGIQSHTKAKMFGYDYGSNLIEVANQYVIGDFRVSEATINPFNQIKWISPHYGLQSFF